MKLSNRRMSNLISVCCSLILVISLSASADWINPPHESLVEQSDLILLGEFIGREKIHLLNTDSPTIVGVIRVESIFKGASQNIVLLMLPPARPHGLVSSADVVIDDGQRGLWYLKKKAEGLYIVEYPYHFLSMKAAGQRIRILKKQQK